MASTSVNQQAVKNAWEGFLRTRLDVDTADLEALDVELQMQLELLPLARQKRNAHTGACRLPSEVLTNVFSHLQAVWWPKKLSLQTSEHGGYGAGWTVVAKVCSYWRKVALGTPSLWCNIDCMSFHPQSVVEIISRSRALPLDVHISGSANKDNLSSWLCGPVNRRIKSLSISGGSRANLFNWITLLYPAMPLLTHLDITVKADPSRDASPSVLPEAFLGGTRPPLLQTLVLSGITCAWELSPASPIMSPSLNDLLLCGADRANIIPPSKVVSTLAPLVNLQSLALLYVLPNEIHTISQDPIPVPSGLQRLDLRTWSSYAASIPVFLEHFPTWPASDITLSIRFNNPDDASLNATVPMLFAPCPSNPVVRSEMFLSRKAIFCMYRENDCTRDWWTTKPVRQIFLYVCKRPDFAGQLDATNLPPDRTLVSKLPLLNLAELRALYTTSDAAAGLRGEHAWVENFAPATKINRISGIFVDLHDLICALGTIKEGASHREISFALFPALEVLVFHARPVKDAQSPTEDANVVEHDMQESTFAKNNVALIDLLAVRDARGRPVKEILVDNTMSGWDLWKMPALRDTTIISFF